MMFLYGYISGLTTLVAASGIVGWWMAKHPKVLVRKIMGSKRKAT